MIVRVFRFVVPFLSGTGEEKMQIAVRIENVKVGRFVANVGRLFGLAFVAELSGEFPLLRPLCKCPHLPPTVEK